MKQSTRIVAASIGMLASAASAIDLSNNLGAGSLGVEVASPTRCLATSVGSGTSAHVLSAATLVLSSGNGASATLEVRAASGNEPGALVGTLYGAGAIASAPGNVTFGGRVALAANATYWMVLRPSSGTIDWSWAGSNTGSGVAFQHTFGVSEDSGAFWWTNDVFPPLARVRADLCPADLDDGQLGGTPDDGVDINDLLYFLGLFEAGAPRADLDGDGVDPPNPDGGVDINDLLYFLVRFEAGC